MNTTSLGIFPSEGPPDFAPGRPGCGKEPLELYPVDHIRDRSVAVLGHGLFRVKLVAGGKNDGPHFLLEDLLVHVEIDGLGLTDLRALPAPEGNDPKAVPLVQGVGGGDGLGERNVDRRAGGKAAVELVGNPYRTDFRALPTEVALFGIHVSGLLSDPHAVVAHKTGNFHHFRVRKEADLGMAGDLHHFRGEDALGAVEGGEGFGKLGHVAADGRAFLDKENLEARVGDVQSRLDSGDSPADHKGPAGDPDFRGGKGLVGPHLFHHRSGHPDGFFRGFWPFVHPGDLLPDVRDLHEVGIQARGGSGPAESLLVHGGRARCHHDAVETMFLNGPLDEGLPGIGTHVLVVGGVDDAGKAGCGLRHFGHVHRSRDVFPAVANENPNARPNFRHRTSPSRSCNRPRRPAG